MFFYLALEYLTIVTHLGTIVCNENLFEFEDNKKETLFKKKSLVFQIDNIN